VTHGVEFEFDSVSVPGTAFISFWGKPCTGPDTCGDGPETDFSSSGAGCTKTITPTDTPGRCPILRWFDNLGNTGTTSAAYSVTIPGECGDLSFDYTRWVIDEAGCIASATHTLTCCECESCPPEGSVTISQYAPQPDGFPIIMDDDGDLNYSPDYDGDNCGPDGGLTCHYIYLDRVDFGSITTAGC
jgi:hypothetical protein